MDCLARGPGAREAAAVERFGPVGEQPEPAAAARAVDLADGLGAGGVGLALERQARHQRDQRHLRIADLREALAQEPQQLGGRREAPAHVHLGGELVALLAQVARDLVVADQGRELEHRVGRAGRGVERLDVAGQLLVLARHRRASAARGELPHALGVTTVGEAVDLGAQPGEGGIASRHLHGARAHLGGGGLVDGEGQQAHRLAQQREARRVPPRGIREDREDQAAGGLLLVFDLEGAPVAEGAAEDPALVEADQEALEQDLLPRIEVRARADEALRVEPHEDGGDLEAVGAQRAHLLVPVAVLVAPALASAAGAGGPDRAVVAEPADQLEGAALGLLEAADPALEHLGGRERLGEGARGRGQRDGAPRR